MNFTPNDFPVGSQEPGAARCLQAQDGGPWTLGFYLGAWGWLLLLSGSPSSCTSALAFGCLPRLLPLFGQETISKTKEETLFNYGSLSVNNPEGNG